MGFSENSTEWKSAKFLEPKFSMQVCLFSHSWGLLVYKITVVKSQHKNTNSKGDFLLKNLIVCFLIYKCFAQIKHKNKFK